MEFYRLEPFGEFRADLRAGIIASTYQNSHGGIKGRLAQPDDYMPYNKKVEQRTAPILNPDPEKQSALILAHMFGIAPGE